MAISAYVGLMGHGKSYQVVKSVILKAIIDGRDVVSNIEGLNIVEIIKYISKHYPDIDVKTLGTIKTINDEQMKDVDCFPTEKVINGELEIIDGIHVNRGDLVVIDEAWKIWKKGTKLTEHHEIFFRKQRHYVNEKGHTSDLVVITQDHTMLQTELKNLIEYLYITRKLKNLNDNMFTLTLHEGNRSTKSTIISHGVHKYDSEIFPMYKSYSKEGAKEKLTDNRVSFWKGGYFKYSVIFFVVLLIGGVFIVKHWTDKIQGKNKPVKELVNGETGIEGKTPIVGSQSPPPIPISKGLKISGYLSSENRAIIFIVDKDNKIKAYNNPNCNGQGLYLVCDIDNQKVSYYN